MNNINNQLNNINESNYTEKELLSILLLCVSKLNINTVSEMARIENKTPKGIRESNNYRKIKIGKQTLVIKGINNIKLPF